MLYQLQQQYKKFRDFTQFFAITLNPIQYDMDDNGQLSEMEYLNGIFGFTFISSNGFAIFSSIVYMGCIGALYFLTKKLDEYQEAANRKSKFIQVVDEEIVERQKNPASNQSEGVPKYLLNALTILLIIVNSLYQQIVEGLIVHVFHKHFYPEDDEDGEAGKKKSTTTDDEENDSGLFGDLGAYFIIGAFVISFQHIKYLYQFVKEQIPKERNIVNEQGETIKYDEMQYQEDIEKQNSPYKSLFKPYKSKYCHCELYIMVLKGAVGLLTLFTLGNNFSEKDVSNGAELISNIFCLIGIAISFGFVFKYQPFNFDGENKIALWCYLSNAICIVLSTFSVLGENSSGVLTLFAWLLRLMFIATPIVQWYIDKKYGPKIDYNLSTKEKEVLKKLEFTPIMKLGFKESDEALKNWIVFNDEHLDIKKCRFDSWHQLWNIIFRFQNTLGSNQEEYDELFHPDNFKKIGNIYPRFHKQHNLTPQERLVENRKIINTFGAEKYNQELNILNNIDYMKIRENILLDVYGEDCHNGEMFGTLDISPFPFSSIYQDDFKTKEIEEYKSIEELKKLAKINTQDHRIMTLKMKRNCFRSLDGNTLNYPCIINKIRTETIGSGSTGQEYKYHGFTMHSQGKGDYGHAVISIHLINGEGFDVQSQQDKEPSCIGKQVDYENYTNFGDQTQMMMYLNKLTIFSSLPKVYVMMKEQRETLTQYFYQRSETLSYHFNHDVLENDYLEQDQVQGLLQSEKNPDVQNIMEDKYSKIHVDNMYKNSKNSKMVYQHYFFNNLWQHNYDVKQIKENEKLLNPAMNTFYGYREFKSNDEFEEELQSKGLKGKSGGGCFKFQQGFFNQDILSNYYRMQDYSKKYTEEFLKKKENVKITDKTNYEKYLGNKEKEFKILEISQEEKNNFINSFKYNSAQLSQSVFKETQQFWIQGSQMNKQQISSYESKKAQTEAKIRQLESKINQLRNDISKKRSELSSAQSKLNAIPHDQQYSSQRNSAQSQVNSVKSQLDNLEQELRRTEQELQTQRQILENIKQLLQIIRQNQHQYDGAVQAVSGLQLQQNIEHHKFIAYVARTVAQGLGQRGGNYDINY